MAGLVAYESSDEEEEAKPQPAPPSEPLREVGAVTADADSTPDTTIKEALKPRGPESEVVVEDEKPTVYGPQIGPSSASGPIFPPLEEEEDAGGRLGVVDSDAPSRPGSPYTATRALLRDLTLPAVADVSIPPSPPGSPPAATSRKFEAFLELKRKKGVHFNARLADTPSMRNPALADKLAAFAELGHRDAYRSTLAPDLWDPDAFPRLAYRERLRQSQAEVAQARTRAAGEPVKFVAAAAAAEAAGVDGKAPQGAGTGKRKTRFDT
ncbi:hypothetical protein F5X97DRAFT_315548 [Nemania serpens]|nr:hypothetical protein F5X97DRAFT_315548 [Nemania serpens]